MKERDWDPRRNKEKEPDEPIRSFGCVYSNNGCAESNLEYACSLSHKYNVFMLDISCFKVVN